MTVSECFSSIIRKPVSFLHKNSYLSQTFEASSTGKPIYCALSPQNTIIVVSNQKKNKDYVSSMFGIFGEYDFKRNLIRDKIIDAHEDLEIDEVIVLK